MIISDLEHLEVVSEETKIMGSLKKRFNINTSPLVQLLAAGVTAPIATGDGEATATAVGTFTDVLHASDTQVASGLFSKGKSTSGAIAIG